MGYELTGQVWDPEGFVEFLHPLDLSWAKGITLHHTGTPSLEQRPHGFKLQHMRNLQHFYEKERRWSAGPHLFVDDDQIFGLSSLERRGVHAVSFNATHIGIEVLGNYDTEDPHSGRGLACWQTAAKACAAILAKTGWVAANINFHRDDPKTRKTCPGSRIKKIWLDQLVVGQADQIGPDDTPEPPAGGWPDLTEEIAAIEWQLRKLKEKLNA